MEAPVQDRRTKGSLIFQVVLGLVVMPGVFIGLLVHDGRPTTPDFPYFAYDLGIGVVAMAFMYALTLLWERRSVVQARERGADPAETQREGLHAYAGTGMLMGFFPAFSIGSIGWRWSLPLYGLYFLYLLQLYLRWRRYQRALAAAG